MKRAQVIALILVPVLGGCSSAATQRGQERARPPIIDMHFHAGAIRSSEHRDSILSRLDADGVVLVVLSIDDSLAAHWHDAAFGRVWVGPAFPCFDGRYPQMDPCFEEGNGWPELGWLEEQYRAGRLRSMGELLYVYFGIPPTDERLAPYWALAEALDIPVGVHTGRGPFRRPANCCPHFDDDLGNPTLLRPILERHPKLRLWLMHAGGWDYLDETIALLRSYPNVYAELSIVNSRAPESMHTDALKAMIEAGLEARIMFGSDNEPVPAIVSRLEAVPFLTRAQKHAIYCGNATRFLRLDPVAVACALRQ